LIDYWAVVEFPSSLGTFLALVLEGGNPLFFRLAWHNGHSVIYYVCHVFETLYTGRMIAVIGHMIIFNP
jgi:hypothetical protein